MEEPKVFYKDDDFEMGYLIRSEGTLVYCHSTKCNISNQRKIIFRYSLLKDFLISSGVSEIFGIDTNNRTIRSVDKTSEFIKEIVMNDTIYNLYKVDLCVQDLK